MQHCPEPFAEGDDFFAFAENVTYNVDLAYRLIAAQEISFRTVEIDVAKYARQTGAYRLDWSTDRYQTRSRWRPHLSPSRAIKIPDEKLGTPGLLVKVPSIPGCPRDIKTLLIDGNHRLARKFRDRQATMICLHIDDPADIARFAYRMGHNGQCLDMFWRKIPSPWDIAHNTETAGTTT